ncbi:hypothetical protein BV22DRAFT_1130770 [Leucogyrophana mollusca]|uniref:Uncharacterized protein n=1 Tax=Leucogyrophana mollusca TaxID=85980 RepID=A0ACB8BBU1_9AGAM|nr:hypothetical protein BV22DRAFT_1130770 [Leucogyrophana mollusca]
MYWNTRLLCRQPPVKNSSGSAQVHNDNSSSSCSFLWYACNTLHAVLVVLHVCLVGVAVRHAEHKVVVRITQKTNMLTTIVSVSLEAFYILYTALLVYITQRVSLLRSLSQWQNVTGIHDLSGAWTGLGSAFIGLWNQFDLAASPFRVVSVAAYLLGIATLHITSSSIVQFQNFNNTISASVPTTIGWPDDTSPATMTSLNWTTITSVASFVDLLAGITTVGLSNSTVYDVLSPNSGTGNATVNAIKVETRCALATGLEYIAHTNVVHLLSNNGTILERLFIPWKDQIVAHYENMENAIAFVVTTAIDASPEVLKDAVLFTHWPCEPDRNTTIGVHRPILLDPLEAYIVTCNVTFVPTHVVVDVQTNVVLASDTVQQESLSPSPRQWTTQPAGSHFIPSSLVPGIYGWVPDVFFNEEYTRSLGRHRGVCTETTHPKSCYTLSMMELNLMKLVGMNNSQATPDYDPAKSSNTTPSFTLSVDRMENAISSVLAKSMWTAGLFGKTGGGFDRATGSAVIMERVLQMRLNINWIPLSFAFAASIVLFALALQMTGIHPGALREGSALKSTGVLELIWLASRSPEVCDAVGRVQRPDIDQLRAAGMFGVRLGDIGVSKPAESKAGEGLVALGE